MKGEGSIVFGGAILGAVEADITLENGQKWRFIGGLVGFEVGMGSANVKGEFPGVDHMAGACTFSIAGGALGKGSFEVRWGDTKGEIATVKGTYKGVNVGAGAGTGDWNRGAAVGERS